jgi:hypothetical protein
VRSSAANRELDSTIARMSRGARKRAFAEGWPKAAMATAQRVHGFCTGSSQSCRLDAEKRRA